MRYRATTQLPPSTTGHQPSQRRPPTAEPDPARILDGLRGLAAQILHDHHNDHGRCAICRETFPCRLAYLAEHNLAL